MQVVQADQAGDAAWDELLATQPTACPDTSAPMRRVIAKLTGAIDVSQVAVDNDRVVGLLPLLELDGAYGRVLNSLPFYGTYGGITGTDQAVVDLLVGAYWSAATRAAAATACLHPFSPSQLLPAGALTQRIGHFITLAGEPPLSGFEARGRHGVSRAARDGVSVEADMGALGWFALREQERAKQLGATPKPLDFYELVADLELDYDLVVARINGHPVAGLLQFYFALTCTCYFTFVEPEATRSQPLAAVVLHALELAEDRGCTRWDFGASHPGQDGVRRFKRQFGAIEVPFAYRTVVNDQRIVDQTDDELRGAYPWFYVRPFR